MKQSKLLFPLTVLFVCQAQAFEATDVTVCIQSTESFESLYLNTIQEGIKTFYGFETLLFESESVLTTIKKKGFPLRYATEDLIMVISSSKPARCDLLVGVTGQDITVFDPHLNRRFGVMGASEAIGGEVAVVSTFRMKLLLGDSIERFLLKTVLHEIGHLLGSDHHPDDSCMMAEWHRELDHNSIVLCEETVNIIEKELALRFE